MKENDKLINNYRGWTKSLCFSGETLLKINFHCTSPKTISFQNNGFFFSKDFTLLLIRKCTCLSVFYRQITRVSSFLNNRTKSLFNIFVIPSQRFINIKQVNLNALTAHRWTFATRTETKFTLFMKLKEKHVWTAVIFDLGLFYVTSLLLFDSEVNYSIGKFLKQHMDLRQYLIIRLSLSRIRVRLVNRWCGFDTPNRTIFFIDCEIFSMVIYLPLVEDGQFRYLRWVLVNRLISLHRKSDVRPTDCPDMSWHDHNTTAV